MIAARSLLHGEHWAGTKKSTSAADAENAFIYCQSVSTSCPPDCSTLRDYHFGIHLVSGRSTALPAVEALPGAIANYAALPGTSFFGVRRIPFVLRARASAFRGAAQSGRR
jgi:hypothetical protein